MRKIKAPGSTEAAITELQALEAEGEELARLIERPDGYYWQGKLSGKLYGPFATMIQAQEDAQYREDSDFEEGASLIEAEDEIGICDWIDPDTGQLAEGSAPHLCDGL